MKRPGTPNGGWINEELIQECSLYAEQILGPIRGEDRNHFICVLADYLNKADTHRKGRLSQTKKLLQDFQKKAPELSNILRKIKEDDSAIEAMKKLEAENPSWFRVHDSFSILSALEEHLDRANGLAFYALDSLPEGNRWQEELKPESDLIENLAEFFQEFKGSPARDFFKHDRISGEYSGQFFELIQSMFEVLHIGQSQDNENLGRVIDMALARRKSKNHS